MIRSKVICQKALFYIKNNKVLNQSLTLRLRYTLGTEMFLNTFNEPDPSIVTEK